MSKSKKSGIGFEVLAENNEQVVYRRVMPQTGSKKQRQIQQKSLPKVKMVYFDKDDIQKLQKIQVQLAQKYILEKEGVLSISWRLVRDFLTR